MKTPILCVLILSVIHTVSAVMTPAPASKMEEFIRKTGGLVPPPAEARKVVVIDARVESTLSFTNNLKAAGRHMQFKYIIKQHSLAKSECPLKLARAEKMSGAGAVLFFYENEDMPVLSVYPEEAITLVNVKPLATADNDTYHRRFNKEFWRSIAFTLGGYSASKQGMTVLAPVLSIEDLDKLRTFALSQEQLAAIVKAKSRMQIYGDNPVSYSRACREGWAPAPTNDIQKAIWNKIHQLPTEPIKIKPETKKVRE